MKDRHSTYSNARLEAIFKAFSEGNTSYDQIERAKKDAEATIIEKIGSSSERKFFKFAKKVDFIDIAQRPHPQDDAIGGVDAWVRFKPYEMLPDLPVQIKSSYKDVFTFTHDNVYKKRHGMIIGLNCGPSVSYNNIMKQLSKEMRRIKVSMKKDPSLVKYI